MSLAEWALPQLSKLLPLDNDSLGQIISYTESLPNREAADHLQNMLGDSPQALEFITSFNNRRRPNGPAATAQPASSNSSEVPKPKPRKKKQAGLGKPLPARRVDDAGNLAGAYMKKDEDDYMAGASRQKAPKSNAFGLSQKPDALQLPTATSSGTATPKSRGVSPAPQANRLPPSAAGQLISEVKSTRNSSPKPKAKITVAGGTPMHGASTALSDLESAIRTLEIQTNPSLSAQDSSKRKCNCMATRHPLLGAAPNCLNCGKVICVKEGIGPCTFCNTPLLSADETQSMIRILREERGKEKMAANNAGQKRAEVAHAPRPFSTPKSSAPNSDIDSENEKLAKAKQHRDKLLAFQAQNAKRTQVHDEAADFETTTAGLSMWASPQERAMQLKRQQKALREQEWNAQPEYEKRKVVASIDLAGGRIVKRMAAAERPKTPESEDEPSGPTQHYETGAISKGSGAFSRNPLLGALIRPTITIENKGKDKQAEKKQTWRRVQDDNDDNEQWILDGGVYGGKNETGEPEAGH
ncbi:putative zinc finger motif, C2HC5-type-domain-containing protein [Boeremia exigua]|uniref:putative zinc finger motif, C2HC5-type-domain-containing protein n=1 Tax=Boeremia exigua TaxID=749465 RepID=UPI001E8EBFC3|nr:putative zinc finger motif, C2HC5-type-domain-containing protein [Boeremia exigua]KAH6618608.1 putative zinc finger motif, C2HC5-type-domain-containing protein [Boeremia exigua]